MPIASRPRVVARRGTSSPGRRPRSNRPWARTARGWGRRLLRSYKDGRTGQEGYLDDYAFLIGGLLDLHEATADPRWLAEAIALDAVLEQAFEDKQAGGYFMTSARHEALLAREKPSFD